MSKFYITTAIDYVNDVIHIGHAYQKVLADCIARYYRQTVGDKSVFFLTGTDEFGQKVYNEAKGKGCDVKSYVDKISKADKNEQDSLDISYDRFIRTTDADHREKVVKFFSKVNKAGYIYKGKYRGLYCEGCEAYKTRRELKDGKCKLHPTKEIKRVEEENYFFKWSAFRDFLEKHFDEHPKFVLPKVRYNEMYKFISGIEDIPITRTKDKLPWGIEMPDDPNHVIWVWFDALINYVTYADSKNIWDENTHIIHFLGKDNARMHALLWPAMLKAAEYKLPDTIYVNGFLSIDGQKISKSLGNVIRPTDLVERFGADAVRYHLLRYGPIVEDTDVSIRRIEKSYSFDLANDLGNLVSRVSALLKDIDLDEIREGGRSRLLEEIKPEMEQYRVDLALEKIWSYIKVLNQYLNQKQPWKKEGNEKTRVLGEIVYGTTSLTSLLDIAESLKPFIPKTSEKALRILSDPQAKDPSHLFPKVC